MVNPKWCKYSSILSNGLIFKSLFGFQSPQEIVELTRTCEMNRSRQSRDEYHDAMRVWITSNTVGAIFELLPKRLAASLLYIEISVNITLVESVLPYMEGERILKCLLSGKLDGLYEETTVRLLLSRSKPWRSVLAEKLERNLSFLALSVEVLYPLCPSLLPWYILYVLILVLF